MTRNATRVVSLLMAVLLMGPAIAMAGGPVSMDIGYDVSEGNYSAISGGTLHASGSAISGFGGTVSLPFSVDWDGNNYDALYVSGNGYVSFQFDDAVSNDKSDAGAQGNGGYYGGQMINAWKNYLSGGSNAQLRTQTLGTSPNRIFVVQWRNVTRDPAGSTSDNLNFQVRIYENDDRVEVVYGNMTLSGAMGAEIGVASNNGGGNLNLVVNYNMNDWMHPMVDDSGNESVALQGFAPSNGLTYTFRSLWNVDASIVRLNTPNGKFQAGDPQVMKVVVKNWGQQDLDSVIIRWSIDGVVQTPVKFYPQPALETMEEAVVQLGTRTFAPYQFSDVRFWTSLPNGSTDGNPGNDQYMQYLAPRVEGTLNIALGAPNNVFGSFRDAIRHLAVAGITGDVNVRVFEANYGEQIHIPYIQGVGGGTMVTFEAAPGNEPAVTWAPADHPNGMYGLYEENYSQVTMLNNASVVFDGIEFVLPNSVTWGSHIIGENIMDLYAMNCLFTGPTGYLNADDWSIAIEGGNTSVKSNMFTRMLNGIYAESYGRGDVEIHENDLENTSFGIEAYSNNLSIWGNLIKGENAENSFTGIYAEGSGNVNANRVSVGDAGRDGNSATGIELYSDFQL